MLPAVPLANQPLWPPPACQKAPDFRSKHCGARKRLSSNFVTFFCPNSNSHPSLPKSAPYIFSTRTPFVGRSPHPSPRPCPRHTNMCPTGENDESHTNGVNGLSNGVKGGKMGITLHTNLQLLSADGFTDHTGYTGIRTRQNPHPHQRHAYMPVQDYLSNVSRFQIIESTLREGEQFANAFFDTETKIKIARALDDFGADYVRHSVLKTHDLVLKAAFIRSSLRVQPHQSSRERTARQSANSGSNRRRVASSWQAERVVLMSCRSSLT